MVRTTAADDDRTAAEVTAEAARAYADLPNGETFAALRGAVEAEDGVKSSGADCSLTAVGWAIVEAAGAMGYDVRSRIGFDDEDVVTVEWSIDDARRRAVPNDLVRLAADADVNAFNRDVDFVPHEGNDRTVAFRIERGHVF